MKQHLTPKTALLAAAVFSACSFLFVNLHAGLTIPLTGSNPNCLPQQTPAAVEEEEDRERQAPMPDVAVLARLLELAQRLAGKN